jgi:signal transduction histidine kinase
MDSHRSLHGEVASSDEECSVDAVAASKSGERSVGNGDGAVVACAAFLDAAYESTTDGVLLISAEGRVARTNRRARELLRCEGLPPASIDEVLSTVRILDAERRPVPPKRLPASLALRGSSTDRLAFNVQFPNGKEVCLAASAAPISARDGAILGAVVTVAAPTDAAGAQGAREDLARMMAQDLRAPLGVILAQAKLLGRRAEAAATVRSRAEIIAASAHRLSAMLADLVDSAQIEAGRLRLELAPLKLLDLVTDVCDTSPPSPAPGAYGSRPATACRACWRTLTASSASW